MQIKENVVDSEHVPARQVLSIRGNNRLMDTSLLGKSLPSEGNKIIYLIKYLEDSGEVLVAYSEAAQKLFQNCAKTSHSEICLFGTLFVLQLKQAQLSLVKLTVTQEFFNSFRDRKNYDFQLCFSSRTSRR